MTFRLIESFVRAKGPRRPSEDVIHVCDRYAAVVDGATAKVDAAPGERTPGLAIATVVARSLERMPGELSGPEAVRFLSEAVRSWHRDEGHAFQEAPSASVAILSAERSEVWSLGDCSFRVGARLYQGGKEIDRLAAAFRAAVIEADDLAGVETAGASGDVGRSAIMPLLLRQHGYRNAVGYAPFAFGALDGSDEATAFLKVVPVPPGTEVVLATDGYPEAKETLRESEGYLGFVLAADPQMVRLYPSTKGVAPGDESHDDRAYVRLLAGDAG